MSKAFYITLKKRGLIHVEGEDRYAFLQGLTSNDVTKVKKEKILYNCLLTPQGKFLHDFFVIHGEGFLLLDCEGGARADDLYERLNKYRLRSDVFLSVEHEHPVYAIFSDDKRDHNSSLADPRHFKMGRRTFEKPSLPEAAFEEWDKERIALGIPDGSRDMEIERSTLLECHIDKFNGLDWDKGCYMGQELTARMHHRGLGKKHLYTITSDAPLPAPFTDIHLNGSLIGNMRSSCDNIGLALLKDEVIEELKNNAKQDISSPIRILG